jgi:hypothetical protein
LRRLADRRKEAVTVTTRTLSRRPSDRQLVARLRVLSGTELPRRIQGRYQVPTRGPATATGRPLHDAAGRRTLRPPRLPEDAHVAEEIELMLADLPAEDAD